MKRVAVVGGGITGFSLAHHLDEGFSVDIYEGSDQVGGLARTFPIADTFLEVFFHHFFKSDTALISLLQDLGLSDRIQYFPSQVGIYHDSVARFSTMTDLLRYNRLGIWSRLAFGLHVLILRRMQDWRRLEKYTVKDWMERHGGKQIYAEIWEPLLKAKFGEYACEIPMSWLWGRIAPRAKSRERGSEFLGYLRGSLRELFKALSIEVTQKGGTVACGTRVESITPTNNGVTLHLEKRSVYYDMVFITTDCREAARMISHVPEDVRSKLNSITYFGVICAVVELAAPLGEIYWLNNANSSLPLSGIVEHTNFVPSLHYNGKHIAYVFKYLSPEHPLFSTRDEEVISLFLKGVGKIYPNFSASQIQKWHLFKTAKATPVYHGPYSETKPPAELVPNRIYLANTSQIYPEDRNLNNSILLVRELLQSLRQKGVLD
ncbi:MAG: NAD(P)/FAD-dependent oxidoreductase [Thermodesulfobacteriota bacterium]